MAEEKKRAVPMIPQGRMQLAEHGRNVWFIIAESSEHPQDFLEPEFYAHVAKDLAPMDRIEITTDDGQYWAELLVHTCDRTWAKVHLLREVKMEAVEQPSDDGSYEVRYLGKHRKWCVIRASDKSTLREGEPDKATAVAWLENYKRTVGRKAA